MPISSRLADELTEVDVIICGGGTAACVVAGRLAESDPNLSILVIEGGENNHGKFTVEHPGMLTANIAPTSSAAITYQAKKSDTLGGRAPLTNTGGILGGGSSANFMLYSRAQGVDFDSWDMPGWAAKDIIPYMKKLETYRGPGKSNHGYSGPVEVSGAAFRGTKTQEEVIETAQRLGYKIYDDLQDPENYNDGIERALTWTTPDHRRTDAAHAYIHPLLDDGRHQNLHVLCESKVVRVLFNEDKRAVGVEYISNPALKPTTTLSLQQRLKVLARKLVVVSCGALSTPSILERSGIGNSKILAKASIPVVADLPSVGENYDDHQVMVYPYTTNLNPKDTIDALWRGDMPMEEAEKSGHLQWNSIDVHGKIRPTEAEVAALGPEFQAAWDNDFKDKPNRPLMMIGTIGGFFGDPSAVPKGQYFVNCMYSAYSYSRGSVHITGPNWEDELDFDMGYLTDTNELDLKMQVWAYKKNRTLMLSVPFCTGELESVRPNFPEGSEAADPRAPNPKYTAEDDKAIEQFIREKLESMRHSLGTAKMAPLEKGGVVDSKLNVYGVHGLKCVDLSIPPHMVAANTNNTAYIIGEKGADIIKSELGLLKADTKGTANGVRNGAPH